MPIADSCCGRGSLALLPSWIRQPSAQLRDRGLLRKISAQHGRHWNRLIVRLIVKRPPKIKKVQKLLVMGGCRREGSLGIKEALQLAGRNGHQRGQGRAAQHLVFAT